MLPESHLINMIKDLLEFSSLGTFQEFYDPCAKNRDKGQIYIYIMINHNITVLHIDSSQPYEVNTNINSLLQIKNNNKKNEAQGEIIYPKSLK